MRKKRILLCNEYSGLNSGYATWGQNLLSRLSSTNKYELAELGCYCSIEDIQHKRHRWRVYPNSVSPRDQRYNTYKASPNNVYGQWRFDAVCLDFLPDIVIDFRDPWMFEYQSFSPLRPYYKWILMPPVDSAPQKNEWITIFSNADLIVPYTEWAKQVLSQYKHLKLYNKISPAGIDPIIFKPIKLSRSSFGLPDNAFVIGSVMRNQKRKLIPALFEMLSKMDETDILYLHTTYPEMNGWDIPSQLLKYKIFNRVYFTYKCKNCEKHYASNYIGITSRCKHCHKNSLCFVTTSKGINDKELANLYNLFDVYVQYAVCEGFGMPQIESAACGVPVFAVDYSAMSEVVRSVGGFPIPLANLQCEMESQAQRAYPNIDATIDLINKYKSLSKKEQEQIKNTARKNSISLYDWANISQVWENILDSIDISTNLNWNHKDQYVFPNQPSIDMSLNNFEFVHELCMNLLRAPWLMRTQMIQYMLHSLDHGFVYTGSAMKPYSKKDILQTLEQFAQHKANIDNIRISQGSINEDYVRYARGTVL